MTGVQNLNVSNVAAQSTDTEQKPTNLYRVNFKASEPDSFVKNSDTNFKAVNPETKQEKKKKSWKEIFTFNNIFKGVFMASLVASIVGVVMMLKGQKSGFNVSKLKFEDLSNDKNIFDLETTKSLAKETQEFFVNLLKKGSIDEKYARRAGILDSAGVNSVLLLGGSGVGKTEVIRAYAKARKADYVAIKLSDFANSYVNGTSKNISEMIDALIARAKKYPDKELVISLDEVDALVKIVANDSSGEIAKNRQSLLTGMDKLLKLKNVKLFTSSNANVDTLDGAFLRRCGYNFTVPYPDETQLLEALKFQMRNCEGAMADNAKFFNVDLTDTSNDLVKFLINLKTRKGAFGDVHTIAKAAMEKYGLDMQAANKELDFNAKYLQDILDNIKTTAGEMAERTGSYT